MAKIFISYRRADATDAAGRIFDRLVAAFGEGNVFKDVDSIPPGSDFANVIAERLNDCNVVIVVIGRFWLTVRSHDGTPRLHNPGDYVRLEIEQALNSRAVVVPALVGNVAMPREEQLPESIRRLTRKNAILIRPDPDFHRDMNRLVRGLQEHFNRKDSPDASPVPPTPTAVAVPRPAERTQERNSEDVASLPVAVRYAGAVWITYGVCLLGGILAILAGGIPRFWIFVFLSGLVMFLIVLPFVVFGVFPSFRGRAKDTLAHGVFSMVLAAVQLGFGVFSLSAGNQERTRTEQERTRTEWFHFDLDLHVELYFNAGFLILSAMFFALAGVLYLSSRGAYRHWQTGKRVPVSPTNPPDKSATSHQ